MPQLSEGAFRIYGEAAFEVLAKAQELERSGKNILHFEIGEPDMETPENICDAGIKAIKGKSMKCLVSAKRSAEASSVGFILLKIEQRLCLNHRYLVGIRCEGVDVQLASSWLEVDIAERLKSAHFQLRKFDEQATISGEAFKVCMALPIQIRAHLLDLKIGHIAYAPAKSAFMGAWAAKLKTFD